MIIDAHHHLWDPARRAYPWLDGDAMAPIRHRYGPAELRAAAEPLGVSGTVLVQTVSEIGETVDFLGIAADNGDLIRGVVGWVDLASPSIVDDVAALRLGPGGEKLVGIRHQAQDEPDPDWLTRPEVLRGLRAVVEAGLTYDLLVLPHQLPSAIAAARAVPEGRFVLDHAAKPPIADGAREPWSSALAELAALDNVACKLSGLITEADWNRWQPEEIRPYAEHVLDVFGPGRLLFGSDWPVCELAGDYERVLGLAEQLCAGLSGDERNAVFDGTATTWYGLRDPVRRTP